MKTTPSLFHKNKEDTTHIATKAWAWMLAPLMPLAPNGDYQSSAAPEEAMLLLLSHHPQSEWGLHHPCFSQSIDPS
jgi:hypothetical protein